MSARAISMNDGPAIRLPRYALPIAAALLALALGLVAVDALKPVLNQPVTALRIDGRLERLTPAQITEAVGAEPTTALFRIDLAGARRRVEALPWVAHARVSRIWPDRLAVRVTERVPYARWGEASLIDSESRVFTPRADEIPDGLPQLAAPDGHEAEVAATFEALRRALDDGPFKPSGLTLDARGEWRLQTVAGIELRLGQGDPQAKTGLLLGAVRQTLAEQLERVAYIDLRYANGFSVGWIGGAACAPGAPTASKPECISPSALGGKKAGQKPTAENRKP